MSSVLMPAARVNWLSSSRLIFVVNVGGHVFVEVVGRTNINIFQDIFVVVATTQVFTFRLQVSRGRTQTEVELVLSNSFEVLCFVRPTQEPTRVAL